MIKRPVSTLGSKDGSSGMEIFNDGTVRFVADKFKAVCKIVKREGARD